MNNCYISLQRNILINYEPFQQIFFFLFLYFIIIFRAAVKEIHSTPIHPFSGRTKGVASSYPSYEEQAPSWRIVTWIRFLTPLDVVVVPPSTNFSTPSPPPRVDAKKFPPPAILSRDDRVTGDCRNGTDPLFCISVKRDGRRLRNLPPLSPSFARWSLDVPPRHVANERSRATDVYTRDDFFSFLSFSLFFLFSFFFLPFLLLPPSLLSSPFLKPHRFVFALARPFNIALWY